jgi:hypothetical protein
MIKVHSVYFESGRQAPNDSLVFIYTKLGECGLKFRLETLHERPLYWYCSYQGQDPLGVYSEHIPGTQPECLKCLTDTCSDLKSKRVKPNGED